MKRIRSISSLFFALFFAAASLHGQATQAYEEESACCAYEEGSRSAHWSVYIPIAITIGAAVWFGLADQGSHKHSESNSQDGLGSIRNSKRDGSGSGSSYSRQSSRSSGSYSH